MPNVHGLFRHLGAKRTAPLDTDFRREITIAVLLKFGLLGLLWWGFFAGQKLPVDAGRVARVMLDERAARAPVTQLKEIP